MTMIVARCADTKIIPLLTVLTILSLAQRDSAEEITAFTEPYRDVDVAASEMGTLARIEVKEGDRVTVGQILATLDDGVLQASLDMAETSVSSRGKLNAAVAELQMHADRFAKMTGLRERQHASQLEVDRTHAQKEIAQANLEAVQDELNIKAKEYQRIQAQLQSRRVCSPIDGVVTQIYKDVGEFISSNEPAVMKVVQLDPLLVVFSAPMAAQDQLKLDDTVAIAVGDEEKSVTGTVEFVSPTIDAQSGTVRVKLRLPNPGGLIKSGSPCRVALPGSPRNVAGELSVTPRPAQQKTLVQSTHPTRSQ